MLLALLVPWAANAQNTLPLYETGTETSEYVPFYGWYGDEVQTDQMIYPADQLTAMEGASISQMVFFWDSQYGSNTLCNWVVKMGTTTATTLSGIDNTTTLTQVYSGAMSFDNTEKTMTIVFDNAFVYSGGNLLIQFTNPVTSSSAYHSYDFLGVEATGASYCYSAQRNFLPRVTFTYEELTEPWISLNPSAATVFTGFTQDITASYGNVTGTPTITYTTSNNKVATVTGSGTSATVTAVAPGTATITATMTYNATDYTATCNVTVEDPHYCTPSFSYTDTNYGLYIKTFSTTNGETNISNTTSLTAGGYADYFDTNSASVEAGKSIDFTVTPGSTTNGMMFAMWIDWNKDFDFNDDGENVAIQSSRIYTDWTGTITIPAATPVGDYRLRIVGMYSGSLEPCTSGTFGEGEDYKLTVLPVATCIKPTGLTVDNGIATWDEGSASLWNLHYKKVSASSWTTVEGLTDATYTFPSNLEAPARYEVQVQADCGGGDLSYWTNSETFDVCATITSFPWSDNFAEITPVTDGSVNNLPVCWSYINTCTNSTYLGYPVIMASGTDNYLVLRSYYNSDPKDQYAILPEMDNVSGLKIVFNSRIWNSSSSSTFTVGVMENPSDATTFEPIKSITPSSVTPEEMMVSLNSYTGTGNYIAFKITAAYDETGHYQHAVMIKDITVEELPKCPEPTDFTVSSTTSYTATLTWIKGSLDQSAWQVYYSTDMTDPDDDINTSLVTPSLSQTLTLSDLTAGTEYYAWVRGDCSSSSSGYSTWVGPIFFYTPVSCTAPTAPTVTEIAAKTATFSWTGDAGNYDVKYSQYPTNTEQELTYSVTQANNYGYNSATTQTWGVKYPASQITGNVLTKVGLHYNPSYNSSTTITIKVYSGGNLAPGTLLYTEVATPNASTGLQTITLSNPVNISSEKNLWITITEYGTFVKATGACTDNNNNWLLDGDKWLHFSVANLGWIINGYMETWNFEAASWTTASCTENTCALTGLTPETDHVALVRSNCGSTDGTSLWAMTKFTTGIACPAPTGLAYSEVTNHTAKLSWTGTSESYNVRYRTAAIATTTKLFFDGFEDYDDEDALEAIWTVNNPNSGETVGLSTSAAKTGTKGFQFSSYNGASANQYLISPVLTVSGVLEFAYKRTSGNETFRVGYSTTTDDIDQFGNWETFTASSSTWVTYSKEIPTDAKYFAINYTSSNKWYLYIDDITIYETVPSGAWQAVDPAPDASPCTISDLSAETKYEVQVQGNCGGEGLSQWSASVLFTTDIACPAPTGLTASNPKSNSFDLQWTNGGSEDWVLAYKVDGAADFTELDLNVLDVTEEAGTISYTLGGLDAETDYIVKVRDNCEPSYAGDGVSEWTAEVPYSTIAACSAMNPVVSNVTHHNATVNWEGESATGFTVNYRTAESPKSIFFEGFETYADEAALEAVWTVIDLGDGTNTSELGLYSGAAKTDDYGFRFSSYNKASTTSSPYTSDDFDQYLISPELTVNGVLGFAYKSSSGTTDVFRVGYSSTTNDLSAFTWGDQINSANSWKTFSETMPAGTKYFAINYMGLYAHRLYIDDINIYVTNPAGAWQTQAATGTTADLTGLTAGTKYDVKVVPNCDPTQESSIVNFSTVSADNKWFITAGEWGTAANWEPTGAPTINQSVTLYANVTIESGCVAEAKTITQGTHTITIEDGGQLKHDNSGVTASVKKHIIGYGAGNTDTKLGYYLISNPLYQTIYKHTSASTPNISSTGMLTGTYDFYNWSNSNQGSEWRNYETSAFDMSSSMYSYLYANEADADLTFTGTLRASNSYVNRYLTDYSSSYTFGAWYLLGNPFVCNAYLVNASTSGTALPYYRMDAVNGTFEAVTSGPIAPMEGIFYEAETSGSVYMVRTAPTPSLSAGNGNLNINIAQVVNSRDAHRSTDNAIIRFDGGQQLGKFSFNENNAKVYIPQDGKDYAVVNAANEGEMPVYFKAAENGNYSISFNAENVEFSYLHLIDNLTGNEVNLLETPSYSFDARTIDYASRFKLVFVTGQANMGDDFGFFDANGNLMILGIEGTATLQMIDVTGRIISSETFSGNYSKAINAKAGVYMLRLIQGNDVRTQKIVVR